MLTVIFNTFKWLPDNLQSIGHLYDDELQGSRSLKIGDIASDLKTRQIMMVGHRVYDDRDVFYAEMAPDQAAIRQAINVASDLQAKYVNLRPKRMNLTLDDDTHDILRRIGHGDVSYGAMMACKNVEECQYCPVTEDVVKGRCRPVALSMQIRHDECLFRYGHGNKSLGLRRAVQLAKICGLVK